MLLLPREHRAPFIAPGRRNRKVHWNRPLHRAINSLGKFEKEDWRRSLWLPESLRQFYPRWNNQFSPGGGSGCGCCGDEETPTVETTCTACCASGVFPQFLTVNISVSGTDGVCTNCASIPTEYVCEYDADDTNYCHWRFEILDFCEYGGGDAACEHFDLFIDVSIHKTTCEVGVEFEITNNGGIPCGLRRSVGTYFSGTTDARCTPGDVTCDLSSSSTDDANDACIVTYPATCTVTFP